MPVDILIYAIIAAVLVFWLRSTLGTRHGDERQRPDPFSSAPPPAESAVSDEDDREATVLALSPDASEEKSAPRAAPLLVQVESPEAEAGLAQMAQMDWKFDVAKFLNGARQAFEMIVEGFASGDREALRLLLAPGVYTAFDGALSEREGRGDVLSADIIGVRAADILEARLEGSVARITVRFTADERRVLKDRMGAVLEGHPDRVTTMVDVWTFRRDLASKDPTWQVVETRGDDGHDDPVPPAG